MLAYASNDKIMRLGMRRFKANNISSELVQECHNMILEWDPLQEVCGSRTTNVKVGRLVTTLFVEGGEWLLGSNGLDKVWLLTIL